MLEDQMVVSCYTEEDAKALMEIAEHEGFLWASGHRPTQFTYFSDQYVARYRWHGCSHRIIWKISRCEFLVGVCNSNATGICAGRR